MIDGTLSVQVVTGTVVDGTPRTSIVMTKENRKGGLVWQQGMTIEEAEACHRALGVALAQVTP